MSSNNPPVADSEAVVTVRSEELFRSARVVCIEHAGQRYQLRLTRENKLILTK